MPSVSLASAVTLIKIFKCHSVSSMPSRELNISFQHRVSMKRRHWDCNVAVLVLNASLCWVPDSLSFKPAKCLQLSVTVFFKRLIEALIHLFILTSFGHFYWKNGFCPSLGHCLVLASTLPWCGDFISFLKTKGGWNCKTLWRLMSKWRILSEKFITYHPIYWNREWCQGGCQYLPEIK